MPEKSRIPTKIEAVLACKCPKCRKGNLFTHFSYHPTKFNKMHSECPECGASLKPEPGFYIGGMYISYGLNVAIMGAFFVAAKVLLNPQELWIYLVAIVAPIFVLFPLNFRVSRSLMLHLFGWIDFDPDAVENQHPKKKH